MDVRSRALGIGLLLLSFRTFSQEAGPASPATEASPRAVAFIVPLPRDGEQDAPFARILAEALRVEFDGAGLEARLPEAADLPELASAPLERLFQEAADADFLILEGYTRIGSAIRLEVEVLRVRDGERIASAATSRRIDLRLDEAVDTAMEQLLPQLRPHIAEAERARLLAQEAQPPVALAEPPLPQEGVEEARSVAPQPEPVPAAEPEGRRERPLVIGAGGGTFFPIVELHPLFRIGYLAEVYVEHRVRWAAASLAIGLYAGYAGLLPAEEGTASFFRSLIPVGLGVRLGTPERSRLGVHVQLQAGAALNASSQSKVGERLTRVLPQLKAGTGLSLEISPWLGLSLEFRYELLLYMYLAEGRLAVEPIMGFNTPSIFIYTRW